MTSDPRDHGGHVFVQQKVLVLNKEAANPAEIDGRKKVLDIDVEDMTAMPMLPCVANDGSVSPKPVRNPILPVLAFC